MVKFCRIVLEDIGIEIFLAKLIRHRNRCPLIRKSTDMNSFIWLSFMLQSSWVIHYSFKLLTLLHAAYDQCFIDRWLLLINLFSCRFALVSLVLVQNSTILVHFRFNIDRGGGQGGYKYTLKHKYRYRSININIRNAH
jgi:hypothetical protein